MFDPRTVLNWYKGQPSWAKWPLVFVLALGVVAAGVWWFLSRVTTGAKLGDYDSTEGLVDALQDEGDKRWEETEEESDKIDEEIQLEWDERTTLEVERQNLKIERDKDRENFSKSGVNASDIVAELKRQREKHRS